MILDIEFVIYSCLLLSSILPLYVYRKTIFKKYYSTSSDNFDLFLKDIKIYMEKNYPKIKIDYSIVQKTKNEQNIELRKSLLIENLIEQFYNFDYKKETQKSISKDKLWVGYDEKSKSNPKPPSDWIQRKDMAHRRDNRVCDRCGHMLLTTSDVYINFVKDIENGGGYNFENLICLCVDCNKILNSKNPKGTISSLSINDKLYNIAKY